jgi:hypothetical protein
LSHSKNTPGKEKVQDHAGHLAGDRFGGSPKIDNLVSQLSDVNLKKYKKVKDKWAAALKETPPKKVTVDVAINYSGNDMCPDKFIVNYTNDGKPGSAKFKKFIKGVQCSMKEFEDRFSELQADMISLCRE